MILNLNSNIVNLGCMGTTTSTEKIRGQIVEIAKRHFAEYGFNGTSLKNIAKEAKVANSLINYHFKDKEKLFKSCIEDNALNRLEAVTRMLNEPKSIEEVRIRLEMFTNEMILSILQDPYSFEIMQRELMVGNKVAKKLFLDTYFKAFKAGVSFFETAKKNKLLKPGMDPEICTIMLFMSTCEPAKKDFMAKEFLGRTLSDNAHRAKMVNHIVTMVINGVFA